MRNPGVTGPCSDVPEDNLVYDLARQIHSEVRAAVPIGVEPRHAAQSGQATAVAYDFQVRQRQEVEGTL